MHGTVDEKTDVFAFGVCLLEMISGRKPVDASHQSLHCWVMLILMLMLASFKPVMAEIPCLTCETQQAKPLLKREEMEKLVDPRLGDSYDISQLKRLTFTASLCIRASSAWRPTMTEVFHLLPIILDKQLLPHIFIIYRMM